MKRIAIAAALLIAATHDSKATQIWNYWFDANRVDFQIMPFGSGEDLWEVDALGDPNRRAYVRATTTTTPSNVLLAFDWTTPTGTVHRELLVGLPNLEILAGGEFVEHTYRENSHPVHIFLNPVPYDFPPPTVPESGSSLPMLGAGAATLTALFGSRRKPSPL